MAEVTTLSQADKTSLDIQAAEAHQAELRKRWEDNYAAALRTLARLQRQILALEKLAEYPPDDPWDNSWDDVPEKLAFARRYLAILTDHLHEDLPYPVSAALRNAE